MSFCNGCGDGEVGGCKTIPPVVARIFSGDSTSPLTRDGHGCPKLNAQRLCMDAKPTKRSFKGKGDSAKQGIVRFWKGWCGAKGGGEAIPPS